MERGRTELGEGRGSRLGLGRLGVVLILAWLGVMLLGGWLLAASQANSRQAAKTRLEARTKYAATFVSTYARDLLVRERSAAGAWLAGSPVKAAALVRASTALGLRAAVLLDPRGHVLAGLSGPSMPSESMLAGRYGRFTAAEVGTAGSVSLVHLREAPVITFAVRYQTTAGPRMFAGAYRMADTVLPTVLNHVLSSPNWRAELLDPVGGGRLAADRVSDDPIDREDFVVAVEGTSWKVVVRDVNDQLYGFLNGTGRWVSWLALAGLAVAGLVIILLVARLARHRNRLRVLNGQLTVLATVDPLTGLRNRRAIEEFLHDALSAARRHELGLSLLLIDVDHFKTFNDRLGHRSGDAVLAHIARALDGALRAEDAIGRWGGEEFLVVLPGTDEEGAVAATERLRAALAADQPPVAVEHGLPVTVTLGVAEWQQEDASELISRADGALYLGKAAGRDVAKVSTVIAAVTDVPEPA
jgi:diguanylate cyclase (GGDEF)-like protein